MIITGEEDFTEISGELYNHIKDNIAKARLEMLFYVDIVTATTRKTGEVIIDNHWVVHPEKGLIFWHTNSDSEGLSGQYNFDKNVADRVKNKLYPECIVVLIPEVYMASVRQAYRESKKYAKA